MKRISIFQQFPLPSTYKIYIYELCSTLAVLSLTLPPSFPTIEHFSFCFWRVFTFSFFEIPSFSRLLLLSIFLLAAYSFQFTLPLSDRVVGRNMCDVSKGKSIAERSGFSLRLRWEMYVSYVKRKSNVGKKEIELFLLT